MRAENHRLDAGSAQAGKQPVKGGFRAAPFGGIIFAQDMGDAEKPVRGGYTSPEELKKRFSQIELNLLRYSSVDAPEFKRKLDDFLAKLG